MRRAGEAFDQVAREISEDGNRERGGEIGLRPASRLPDLFTDAVRSFKVGEVSAAPLRSGAGFHVLKLLERGVPRHGYPILNEQGESVGEVTSGTMAPSLNEAIGMAYVPSDLASPGSRVWVEVRGKALSAEVVSLPFYKA